MRQNYVCNEILHCAVLFIFRIVAIVEFAFNYPSITQETGAIASQLITHNLVILARGEDNWIQKLQGASRGNEDASVLEILSDAFQLATLKGKRKGKICCICSNLIYVSQNQCKRH